MLSTLLSLGFLFQFTTDSLTVCNFWSGSTLLGTFAIYDHMLVDLFNMFLSLPGNLLCFVPPFKPYMIQVFVKDWHGKNHIFRLIQTATVSDLEKQIYVKFKLPHSEYWLSGPGGNKMKSREQLVDLTTIHIRGRLFGGSDKCCIKGCSEKASRKKITCLGGVYELKMTPDILCQANDLPLYICNHHYYFQKQCGHKPKRLYQSVQYGKKNFKTSEKNEMDDVFLCLV